MSDFKERMERHRDRLYREMKAVHPDLYEGAIRVGHLAFSDFVPGDETKRAAEVEAAAIHDAHAQ